MATATTSRDLIEAVASEMSDGIQRAVQLWIMEIEDALEDPRLTTLGRLRAVQEVIQRYHTLSRRDPHHDGYAA